MRKRDLERALKAIRERGYMNEWATIVDTWWTAHSVPGGLSEDAIPIKDEVAERLIHTGAVEKLGTHWSLGGDASRVTWYHLRPEQAGGGQA